MKAFFFRQTSGKQQWWAYLTTFFLVISGMLGFGNMPLLLFMSMKGFTAEQLNVMTPADYEAVLGTNLFFTFNLVPFMIGFGMLLIAFKFVHYRPIRSYFTSRKVFDFKRFLTGFALTGLMMGILFVIGFVQGAENLVWNYEPEAFFTLFLICLFIVPLQTGFEELMFRGYLLQLFGRATSRGIVVIVFNGLLFGMLHSFNPEVTALGWFAMVFYVMAGIFASFITLMDDGIELSWGFHTVNNFFGILLVTNKWQVFHTDALFLDTSKPAVGWDMFVTLFICYPLLVLAFAKIYKWAGWKQRLLGS